MSNSEYFAAGEAKKAVSTLLSKIQGWNSAIDASGYITKIKDMYAAYHGANYSDINSAHQINFSGEQGELVNLSVNHLRNLGQHMLNITTANRPTMEARAVNTDYKSLVQTYLANGLLDYYMREKRLEKYLKVAAEYAIVFGAGFVKIEWNALTGEIYDYTNEGAPIYEGDIEFSNLSPLDVIFDTTKESFNHDWILCRSYKSRFDLMAKYPEFADKIRSLPSKGDKFSFHLHTQSGSETEDIPIYEFYHKRSEAMPNGRYLLFLDDDVVLIDTPLPYKAIPVYRVSPGDILGTPFGYTPLFDLLPLQEAVNMTYSTILTNQNAFGVQNIWVPRGVDIAMNSLGGNLNILEGNAQNGKPEALQLTATPKEVFDFMGILERTMETISGVNSVSRGNPEASLKSGAALALVQSMTLQFMSGLQQQYVQLIEDVGTGLINILKDFAAVPRVAAIVGKNNRTYMKEFKGEDLKSINRVIVDMGNPLSRSTAGRVQMAEQMLQMGIIKNPQDYFTVLNTGQLNSMTEDSFTEMMLIRGENEKMVAGEPCQALAIDTHTLHINEHRSILNDPDVRQNPMIVTAVLNHIQEHIGLLQTVDPALLQLLGQQSLQAPPMPPEQGGMPPPMEQGNVGQNVQMDNSGHQEISGPGLQEPANIPQVPNPPAPFENNPVNAQDAMIGQQ